MGCRLNQRFIVKLNPLNIPTNILSGSKTCKSEGLIVMSFWQSRI